MLNSIFRKTTRLVKTFDRPIGRAYIYQDTTILFSAISWKKYRVEYMYINQDSLSDDVTQYILENPINEEDRIIDRLTV